MVLLPSMIPRFVNRRRRIVLDSSVALSSDPLNLFLTGSDDALVDEGFYGLDINLVGGVDAPKRSTAQSQFGGASIDFTEGDNNNDHNFGITNSLFAVGDGDFTFECFVYRKDPVPAQAFSVLAGVPTRTNGWYFQMRNSDGLPVWVIQNTPGAFSSAFTTGAIPLETWTHLAFVKEGDTAKCWVGGTFAINSVGFFTAKDWNSTEHETIHIGGPQVVVAGTDGSIGWFVDEIRIRNEAVYTGTGSITVPTAPFSRA